MVGFLYFLGFLFLFCKGCKIQHCTPVPLSPLQNSQGTPCSAQEPFDYARPQSSLRAKDFGKRVVYVFSSTERWSLHAFEKWVRVVEVLAFAGEGVLELWVNKS